MFLRNKWLTFIVGFLLSIASFIHYQISQASDKAHDFHLNNWDGKPVSLASLRGKAVVLVFSYSYCSVSCPVITGRLAALDHMLKSPQDLVYLHVGVDPKNDTQDNRRKYFGLYEINPVSDKRWMFVSGHKDELAKLWNAYNIKIKKIQEKSLPEGYFIEYTPKMVIFDKDGLIKLQTDFFFLEAEISRIIKEIL